jgi:nucleoside-diphosphate-sugar epimerase
MSDFLSFMDIAIQSSAPTGVYNVSSGEAHSIREIFDLVSDYLKLDRKDVPITPPEADDVPMVSLDPVETSKAFDWRANVLFADTIKNQLAWYDAYGVNEIFTHLKEVNHKND